MRRKLEPGDVIEWNKSGGHFMNPHKEYVVAQVLSGENGSSVYVVVCDASLCQGKQGGLCRCNPWSSDLFNLIRKKDADITPAEIKRALPLPSPDAAMDFFKRDV